MTIMRNITEGISPTEISVYIGSRRTGKSTYAAHAANMEIARRKFIKIASSVVDNEPWLSVIADETTAQWLRTQDKSLAIESFESLGIHGSVFDVHEKIYVLMVLTF